MKKNVLPLLFVFFMLTGCGSSNNTNKLIIGIDDDFPPVSFHDATGTLVGFDIDLAKEAARRLGVKAEFKPIDWNDKEEEITSGHVDMIWNGLDVTDKRKEYMLFSKPYMDDRQIILVRKEDDSYIYSEYDLEGKSVGTQAGSTSDDYINHNETLKKIIGEYKTYGRFSEAIAALMNDDIEAVVCDELIARYEMNRSPNQLKIINIKIGAITETAIGFRKDNFELRDKVQKAFDDMIEDGTASRISEKWFKADLIKRT